MHDYNKQIRVCDFTFQFWDGEKVVTTHYDFVLEQATSGTSMFHAWHKFLCHDDNLLFLQQFKNIYIFSDSHERSNMFLYTLMYVKNAIEVRQLVPNINDITTSTKTKTTATTTKTTRSQRAEEEHIQQIQIQVPLTFYPLAPRHGHSLSDAQFGRMKRKFRALTRGNALTHSGQVKRTLKKLSHTTVSSLAWRNKLSQPVTLKGIKSYHGFYFGTEDEFKLVQADEDTVQLKYTKRTDAIELFDSKLERKGWFRPAMQKWLLENKLLELPTACDCEVCCPPPVQPEVNRTVRKMRAMRKEKLQQQRQYIMGIPHTPMRGISKFVKTRRLFL